MAGTSALDEPRLRDDLSAALLRRVRQPGRRPGRGHAPICPAGHCGQLAFPRIELAVTVLVESAARPDRCLRRARWQDNHGLVSPASGR